MSDPHSLVAPYALDALDDAEARSFERHLAGCEQCRDQLAGLREAAAALAYGAEGPAPPPELRQRILEQARSERLNVVPLWRRRWALPASGAVAAAAACAAIGLGIWASSLSNSLDRERTARQAQARALAVLVQPSSRRVGLAGANGALVVAASGEAALVVSGVRRAPKDKTYEAWVISNGKPARAGLFGGGSTDSVVPLSHPVPPGAIVAVTLERAGGVDAPTRAPFIRSGKV